MIGSNGTVLLLALLGAGQHAADVPSIHPLKGVSRVTVSIRLSAKDLPSVITEARLRTVVELRLRSVGLRVLSPAESAKDSELNPFVDLDVIGGALHNTAGASTGFVFGTGLSVRQYQVWAKNGAVAPIELWANSYVNVAGREGADFALEQVLGILLDELSNEWLKANPR